MKKAPAMSVWVLYHNPKDFPGEWVIRRQTGRAVNGEVVITPDPHIAGRGKTRAACIKAMTTRYPKTKRLAFLKRSKDDDACIVGSFI